MSLSYNASTAYDALNDSVYDIFDLDSYCSSLSPPVPDPEPVPNTSVPTSHLKRYPKTHGHPRPSPGILSPPTVASTSTHPPVVVPPQPDKGKGRQCPAVTLSPACSVDPPPSVSTASIDLTPEQHLCLVRVLKHLDEWFAQEIGRAHV